MDKKKKVAKKPSPTFFVEDDTFMANYFTSVGYVDLWSDTEAWIDLAARLTTYKGSKVYWMQVRDRWDVVDRSLEKLFNVKLVTRKEFGLQQCSTLRERCKIYNLRLHDCIDQMRERSNKKKIVCEKFYSDKLTNPPVFPSRFESPDEGAHCLDNSSLVLPPKIFNGQLFYLNDSKDTYSELASRNSLEYLIKIHGGIVVQKVDGHRRPIICITGRDEEKNQKLYNTYHDNIYLPSLVYDHVDAQISPTSMTMMDHVYFYQFWDVASGTLVSDTKQGSLKNITVPRETVTAKVPIEKSSQSKAGSRKEGAVLLPPKKDLAYDDKDKMLPLEVEMKDQVGQPGPFVKHVRSLEEEAVLPLPEAAKKLPKPVYVDFFAPCQPSSKSVQEAEGNVPNEQPAPSTSNVKSQDAEAELQVQKPCYLDYLDLEDDDGDDVNMDPLDTDVSYDGSNPNDQETIGSDDENKQLRWALFFKHAKEAKTKRALYKKVCEEYLKEKDEKLGYYTAKNCEISLREKAKEIFSKIAAKYKLEPSMLDAI